MTELESLLLDGDGDDNVLHFDGTWYSRRTLADSARELAGLLTDLKASSTTVVAALLPSSPACVAAMFGTWAAGSAYAPLNPKLTEVEIRRFLDELRPVAVLVPESDVSRESLDGQTVIAVEDLTWALWAQEAGETGAVDDGTALVLYTSGTTGRPKPVMLRRQTLLDAMAAVLKTIRKPDATAERSQARPPMPNLLPFPLYLWSGIYNVCFALRAGSSVVAMPRFEVGAFANLVREFGIRSVVVAPAMIAALLESDLPDLEPLRFVRNGTAPLPVSLAQRFHERFGVTVLNGYGQTELGGEVIGWNADDARQFGAAKLGSVGRPHPNVVVRILDDEGNDVATGEPGELCVKSPFMMAGYLRGSASERLTTLGFLRTGDLGHLDEDGFVWLDGRRSDLINRSGLKVFPDEVEDALRDEHEVADVSVVGVPDERVGEVPWAFVVPRDGVDREGLDRRLDAAVRQRLVAYKVPAGYTWVDELPRNDVGKVLRHVLRERLLAAS